MNHKCTYPSVAFPALSIAFAGCFKDEPLNAECDIMEASVTVAHPAEVFFHESDTLVTIGSEATTITFTVRRAADLTSMAPRFRITDGATIEPASGTVHDFSRGPVIYTVTSENREWSRRYEVALRDALHSTEMGVPFTGLPQKLTGYYRYQRGAEYKNKAQQVLENHCDSADIYAVLYRNHNDEGMPTVLCGDNVLSSPLIVRKARIDFVKPTDASCKYRICEI